ncbi:MAG TPA: hypothetical protein VGW38_23620 [Chloroflexota bacterium]|nr:hypothetical protein [Chloroflexota bacterium]
MQITRLPISLVRREHGMTKDHVVVLNEDGTQPMAWRVNASFAGYLAGMMAELIGSPEAVAHLERRIEEEVLMPESRILFRDMVRTARQRQGVTIDLTPPGR